MKSGVRVGGGRMGAWDAFLRGLFPAVVRGWEGACVTNTTKRLIPRLVLAVWVRVTGLDDIAKPRREAASTCRVSHPVFLLDPTSNNAPQLRYRNSLPTTSCRARARVTASARNAHTAAHGNAWATLRGTGAEGLPPSRGEELIRADRTVASIALPFPRGGGRAGWCKDAMCGVSGG